MKEKIQELTQKFIEYDSSEWNQWELDTILDYALWFFLNFTIERFESNWIKSALVYNTTQRADRFDVLLNCHLDIIPWKKEQFTPVIDKDKIIWAWAYDMKWNVAASIYAFLEVAESSSQAIAIQFTTDEEIWWFNGTKYQVDNWVSADFIIATEPTNLNIVHKAKWVLWLKIKWKWKTSHGAYPWRWENAIEKMGSFISDLKQLIPDPKKSTWKTTTNIASISSSNKAFNKIPDDCEISVDIRYIPEEKDDIINKIEEILPDWFTLDIIENEPSVFVKETDRHIVSLQSSIHLCSWIESVLYWAQWTSDGRHFSNSWWRSIEFWAIGWWIGQDDEWVSISSLEIYYNILCDFLMKGKQ